MKILIVFDDYRGGAGNMAQILALNLIKMEHKVALLLTNNYSEPRYDLREISTYNLNYSDIKGRGTIRFIKMISETHNIILDIIKPELIISFICNNNIIVCLSLLKYRIPIIVSERSNPVVVLPEFPWNILRRIAYKRRADVVSVQFECFKSFDRERYKAKSFVIPNIIERAPFGIKKADNNLKIRFISCGRLDKVKRFDLMIRYFYRAYIQNCNIELYIYGEGVERDNLDYLIEKLNLQGVVFLKGYCSNVYKELRSSDIYLMTSFQEGFPNALSEAISIGLPSIVIKCHDGIGELVQDGVNGYAVSEGDQETFVNSMIQLSLNQQIRYEFGLNAKRIAEKFDESEVMKIWAQCIKYALNRNWVNL